MNIVLVIPASLLDKASALGEAMGWGPNNYSIALSADGSDPATHWSLNLENPKDSFTAMLLQASEGLMPEGLDFPQQDFSDIMYGLSIWTNISHHDAVAAMGLQPVVDE